MANLAPTSVWEIRTTGSDANGGMYDPSASGAGTDYSQQNSPQLSLADIVTNGTSTVTSATGGFTSAMIGNGINVAGTVYEITAVGSSTSITVMGTPASATGQIGKVGGALASIGYIATQFQGGNIIFVGSGTYIISTATANVSGGPFIPVYSAGVQGTPQNPTVIQGYATNRALANADTPPIFDASGTSMSDAVIRNDNAAWFAVDNIEVHPYANGGSGIILRTYAYARRCIIRNGGWNRGLQAGQDAVAWRCLLAASTMYIDGGPVLITECEFQNSIISLLVTNLEVEIAGCLFWRDAANAGIGTAIDLSADSTSGNTIIVHNTIRNYSVGIQVGANMGRIANNLVTHSATYGISCSTANRGMILERNAGYANTSGSVHPNLSMNLDFLNLTSDPHGSGADSGDLSLSGPGASQVKAISEPGLMPAGLSTSYRDIGAVQHQDSGGGGTTVIVVEED